MDAINFQTSVARMHQAMASRAYGPARTAPVTGTAPVARASALSGPPHGAAQANRARIVSTLVGGQVPGGVVFRTGAAANDSTSSSATNATPGASGTALPMYRHPADKNAAATSVWSGRTIDVQG